ncbi:MAG: hypothetical protein U9Q67_00835 [Patescibacteria group bacterium]|nr:hypothetical protein [Patescibacteria group bacterium]
MVYQNSFGSQQIYSAIFVSPDVKYQEQFSQVESEARDGELGLWGDVCGTDTN